MPGSSSAGSRTSDRRDADASGYRVLLRAVIEGRSDAAKTASAALLAGGAPAHSIYRIVARALLPWAAGAPHRGGTPRLDALTAVMSLGACLPHDEGEALLIRAIGWAAGRAPVGAPVPHALPWMPPAKPIAWAAAGWGERVGLEVTNGNGATAEWALSLLLAGPDGGTLPAQRSRQAAYTALFAASAEHASGELGRVLVTAQYAMEMAELLPPALTFLALRPALWTIARAAGHRARRATPLQGWLITDTACALRWNRRAARPGETAEWARALRTDPLPRVVEEALASGLGATALLDAAILAALAPAGMRADAPSSDELSGPTARVVLALHAARRAHALAERTTAPVLAALSLLQRLPRVPQVRLARRTNTPPGAEASITSIARAAAQRAAPPAVLFGAAIAREYAEARQRAPDYATLLLRGAESRLGLPARGDAMPTTAHRAS